MVETNTGEEVWRLDELQDELDQEDVLPSPSKDVASLPDNSTLAESFIQTHQPPPYSRLATSTRLELPVIITQRRPKDRTRGFIRAYAPVLQDVGIDQQAFLDFIGNLNKAVEPSPWIQAINLASFAAQHVPEPVTLAVSIACKMAADAASSAHSRVKTNSFLDKVNEEYFKTKGLIALLVTWKPNDPSIVTDFNSSLGSTISNASSSSEGSLRPWKHRMQSSSGASSFAFPATAPLIFPALDEFAHHTSEDASTEAKKQSVLKRGGAFLADYQDRRAVAEWAGANPDSNVANAAPTPEFRSRYSDPNHPASSGDLLAFVTGGKISASALSQQQQRTAPGSILDSVRAGRRGQVGMMAARRRELMSTQRPAQAPGIAGVVSGVKGLLQKVSSCNSVLPGVVGPTD